VNFDFTDDQQQIKRTARELLAQRSSLERVREAAEAGTYDDALWSELVKLGWPGIAIAEEYGGQELGVVELVILLEELGYAATPSRFFSNAAAGLLIDAAGSDEQRTRWLPGIASGEATATVGVARDGVAELVPDADSAAVVVLVEDGAATVYDAASVTIEPRDAIDLTRRYARVTAAGGAGEALSGNVAAGLDRVEVAVAAELVGIAQRALEMTLAYAKERQQFGRPIGSYQAVSHRCAQMLLETEGARSATYFAAWAAGAEPERLPFAASIAKAAAADAGRHVTASAIQAHGGIGFTWEHDLHWLFKRAHTDAALFGSAREHRERVALLAARRTERQPVQA
jgi:alkylation response protein AidB-like acyl-CoA dehydrogenase